MRLLQATALILGLSMAQAAISCSCVGVQAYSDKTYLADLFTQADSIVHARVLKLVSNHEAHIEVIESFKGRPAVLKAQPGDGAMCGTEFRADEEAIFVSYRGQVSLCGRIPASDDLIRRFREYKR